MERSGPSSSRPETPSDYRHPIAPFFPDEVMYFRRLLKSTPATWKGLPDNEMTLKSSLLWAGNVGHRRKLQLMHSERTLKPESADLTAMPRHVL